MKLIAQVKLQPTKEQAQWLKATIETANAAANLVSGVAWQQQTFKQYDLHQACYYAVREQFGLSAQMAVRLIAKVADAYKLDKKSRRAFKPLGSIAYDDRILTWKMPTSVSIWTLQGRIKVPFVAGERQLAMLETRQGEADLVYRNGEWFLFQTCEVEEPPTDDPDGWLGVDMGIVNIATTSDGENFSGAQIEATRQWHDKHKATLQKVGTLNAKRRLRKLSGRQQRFQKDTNHKISRKIVETAKDSRRGIAIEELGGIRARVTVRRRQRARHANWSFFQLRAYIAYKAKWFGVAVQAVDPRNTSKTCSVCGHCDKANRPMRDDFLCCNCGYAAPADCNAALNISARAAVLQPMVSDTDVNFYSVAPETSLRL
jgi:putative transposase